MNFSGPARHVSRSLFAWHPEKVQPAMAMRAATGMAVTIVLAMVAGPGVPTMAAILGAWCAGIPLLVPGVRPRPSLPLLAGVAIGAAVWLGELGGHGIVIGLVISTLWALAMAFIGSLNSAVSAVTTVCGVALVLAPAIAGHSSGMIAAMAAVTGGLIQAITALLPPWSKNHPERHALASAYRDLAAYARGLALKLTEPLPTESLLDTDTTIGERRRVPEALREASSQLYDLRAALIAVGVARARLQDDDPMAARRTARVLRDTADALESLSTAVKTHATVPREWEEDLAAAIDAGPSDESGVMSSRHTVAGREIRRLQRSLHRTARLAERVNEGGPATTIVSRRVRVRSRFAEEWQTLRANISWQSPGARHSLRAAGTIAVATALGFLWPGDHGYWLPLTAWIVLRPDFAGTVGRGIERTLATTLGVFLTTLLALVVDDRSMWAAATVAVFAAVAYLVMPVSFFVFSLMVAGFAVFQIDLIDAASIDAAIERGVATLIGGSLAILLYWILPTWQTRRLPDLMGDLIDAYREYASLVLGFQARPTEKDAERLRHVVDEVRLRQSSLTAAADQAAVEPIGGPRPYSEDILDLDATLQRALRALIVMEGAVERQDAAQLYGIDEFAEAVDAAYERLGRWVRTGDAGQSIDLDLALSELDVALGAGSSATRRRRRLLDWESDILTEALKDAGLVIAEWKRDG